MSASPRHDVRVRASSLLALAALACAPACASEEPLDPARTSPTSEPEPEPEPPPPAPSARRTVIERDPFGNVAERENLLWDGDFEWASPFADQYGWFEPPTNPTVSDVVAGAACRSGVKCARLARGRSLVGIGVGSRTDALRASVWVRFEPGSVGPAPACDEVSVFLFGTGGVEEPDPDFDLSPDTSAPDADGACRFAGLSPPRRGKVYLLVRNRSQVPILVDDAVLARVEGEVAPSRRGPSRTLLAAEREALDEAKRAALVVGRPHDGRPNPAREAFERRKRVDAR
jgi:hypothetical protein